MLTCLGNHPQSGKIIMSFWSA